jgi:hypothetical protein
MVYRQATFLFWGPSGSILYPTFPTLLFPPSLLRFSPPTLLHNRKKLVSARTWDISPYSSRRDGYRLALHDRQKIALFHYHRRDPWQIFTVFKSDRVFRTCHCPRIFNISSTSLTISHRASRIQPTFKIKVIHKG